MERPLLFSTVRLNSLKHSVEELLNILRPQIEQDYSLKGCDAVSIWQHHAIPELLVIQNILQTNGNSQLPSKNLPMAVVDKFCGGAVLRGAHVFAIGVLCLSSGVNVGDEVNLFADLDGKCLKGAKEYSGRLQFLGVAIAKFSRASLFGTQNPSGVALELRRPLCVAPSFTLAPDVGLPQNLPSALTSRVLDVRPGQCVLDMCAAPGGKTSHLAWLMRSEGILVALEKSKSRAEKLRQFLQSCEHCRFVKVFAIAAEKSVTREDGDAQNGDSVELPPFCNGTFDRVLLDAPCSALGQRPRMGELQMPKGAESLPAVQRRLFRSAMELLKPRGLLVYSTCTTVPAENEDIVRWAIETFGAELQLCPQEPCLRPYRIDGCDVPVQKFDPTDESEVSHPEDGDTIGFFIAKFQKKCA